MKLMFFVLAGAAALEGSALLLPAGRLRKFCAAISLTGTAFASGGMLVATVNTASVLVALASAYRIINMLRLSEARIGERHLRKSTRQTSVWLIAAQLILLAVWYVPHVHPVRSFPFFVGLIVIQLVVALLLVASTVRHLRTTKLSLIAPAIADRDLPTVTVAIPARNEDEQLEECLQSVLASDYPKLEVLVLDDCSQDKTPAIIRGFAHDGVRFVQGEEPDESWLAKNQAYDRLAQEASGDLIVFCGVDVRFGPHAIRTLVVHSLQKHKTMLSVMPLNEQASASVPQTVRYLWELALPRRMFRRPPILSSCWMIERNMLTKLGGFAAVSRSIVPEAYFAKQATLHDEYSFLRSGQQLGLSSVKSAHEQRATAIRMRYPQLHRRIELVALVAVLELALLLAPFAEAIVGLWGGFGVWPEIAAITSSLLLLSIYRAVAFAAFPRNRWALVPNLPIAIVSDLVLLHYSMSKYEFSEVIWKGRNVCIPAMHVIPRLPKF